ncbi:MAG: leucine-rich repeat protein [Treponema sp.]|nr:leucine-rich repeat protein [Treponema sp.]
MKKYMFYTVGLAFLIAACMSSGESAAKPVSLDEAIQASAQELGVDLRGRKVAVISFSSDSDALSEYVIEELSRALGNDKAVVAVERPKLDLAREELRCNESGEVSGESAQSIGKSLGAEVVVTGSLSDVGNVYRFGVNAISVESAAIESAPAFDVGKRDAQAAHFLGGQAVAATKNIPPVSNAPQTTGVAKDNPPTDDVSPPPEGLGYEIIGGKSVAITAYAGSATSIVIPARIQGLPVTAIETRAFADCKNLASITLPSSVTTIGTWAFSGCGKLASVVIPSSVTSIGERAFSGCGKLASITLPSSVITIGEMAFANCDRLTSITIPSSMTVIGQSAFADCKSLKSITIPSSVLSIGEMAFAGCKSLTSITIPSSVTSIGERAFANCGKLTGITLPSSVTSIGEMAFANCDRLKSILVDGRNSDFASGDGVLFDRAIRTMIAYPGGRRGSYTLPSSVTSIRASAFSNCGKLTGITIPSSATTIGEKAFANCDRLKSIQVDKRNSNFASSDGVLFDRAIRTIIAYPSGRKGSSYIIPSSVTSIGAWAFANCDSLASITIPSSVTTIEESAFSNCDNLTSVALSQRTRVGYNAFPNRTKIVYRD